MKREFLTELGLEKEAIDKIMAENGKDIEKEKTKTEKAETERDGLKETLESTQEELKKFEGLDVEGQKKMIDELKLKYDTDTKALQEKLDTQNFESIAKDFLGGYKFTSELAKKQALTELKGQGFKLDGTTILGAKDFMTKMQEDSPTAFVKEEEKKDDKTPPPTWGNKTGGAKEQAQPDYSFPK